MDVDIGSVVSFDAKGIKPNQSTKSAAQLFGDAWESTIASGTVYGRGQGKSWKITLNSGHVVVVGKSFVHLGDGIGPSSQPNPLPSVPRGRTLLDGLIGEGD